MSWNPLHEPADKVWLAQNWSPGLCDIEGANSPREWEERPGYGWSGSFLWFKGIRLAHFTIRIRLYTDDDWTDWYAFKPLIDRPPAGHRPRAIDVWHPILVNQGIHSLVVEDVGPTTQGEPGEWIVEIKCIEYRAPKYALSQPNGAKATPVDPFEQMTEQLTKKAVDLMSEP